MKPNTLLNRPTRQGAHTSDGDAAGGLYLLARFAVLGAFVLGLLPASADNLAHAQARKAGTDTNAAASRNKGGGGANKNGGKASDSERSAPAGMSTAPFKAFITRSRKLADEGKLDLSKRHSINVVGDRQEDGAITNAVISGDSSSDPHMRRTAEDFVAALSESRVLQPLEGVSRVSMTFTLDGERFTAQTASDTPSEARAEEMARGYRVMLNVAKLMRRGTAEGAVIGGMKISSNGKQLLMNLDTTREAMGNLLLKQITPN